MIKVDTGFLVQSCHESRTFFAICIWWLQEVYGCCQNPIRNRNLSDFHDAPCQNENEGSVCCISIHTLDAVPKLVPFSKGGKASSDRLSFTLRSQGISRGLLVYCPDPLAPGPCYIPILSSPLGKNGSDVSSQHLLTLPSYLFDEI